MPFGLLETLERLDRRQPIRKAEYREQGLGIRGHVDIGGHRGEVEFGQTGLAGGLVLADNKFRNQMV